MSKSLSIRIGGRVQGVFFRASTQSMAEKLDIRGVVRNEPDGTVYIEAEAEEENLNRFVNWCRKGPPGAQVMTFVIAQMTEKGYVGFRIIR